MIKIVILTPIMYTYLKHGISDDRMTKVTKKFVITVKLKFEDFKICLKNNVKILLKTQ